MSLFIQELIHIYTNTQNVSGYGFDYGRRVQLQLADGTIVGTPTTVDATGNFSVALDDAHRFRTSGDSLTLYLRESDSAENTGISAFPQTVTYNTIAPVIRITRGGGEVDPRNVSLSGTISASFGADRISGSILIYEGGRLVGGGGVASDSTWSATAWLFGDGVHSLTAQTVDAANNLASSASVVATVNVFGSYSHDVHSLSGEVYALYDGLLGRAPDALGLEGWVANLQSGNSLHNVAAAFLASPEGQMRAGSSDNTTFVEQLYGTNLHRHSDAEGLRDWISALDHGTSRADVALGFALSSEHLNALQGTFYAGVYVPNHTASDIARLYYGLLNRSPDAGGLQYFTNSVAHGVTLHDAAQAVLQSSEYRSVSTGYTDAQYVESLYENILGRTGDGAGAQVWSTALDHGTSRGGVVNGFVDSFEFQSHYASASDGMYVETLYEHVLGRAGEDRGVSDWVHVLDSHSMTRVEVAHAFTASAEFQSRYVSPSDAAFVDFLSTNALGHHADTGSIQHWSTLLAQGSSRADVAVAIVESPEAQVHLAMSIEAGWHLT